MTKEQFLQSCTIENISQTYSGRDNVCRCGCAGTYTATSYMKNPRSEVNDKLVESRLKRAKRLILSGADARFSDNHLNISTGHDRALTFYFDEL